jgi:hypothetical protein
MSKRITKILAFVSTLGVMLAGVPAFASMILFSPTTISGSQGATRQVSVIVDPQGATLYSAQVELRYPASSVEVTSFTYTSNVIALSQPGYDSVDNTAGVLIKSAGFPGGISVPTVIGTATFRIKKAGQSEVTVGSGTKLLNDQNANMYSANGVSLKVSGSGVVSSSQTTTNTSSGGGSVNSTSNSGSSLGSVSTNNQTVDTSSDYVQGASTSSLVGFPSTGSDQGAAAAEGGTSPLTKGLLIGLGVLLVLIALVYFFARGTARL